MHLIQNYLVVIKNPTHKNSDLPVIFFLEGHLENCHLVQKPTVHFSYIAYLSGGRGEQNLNEKETSPSSILYCPLTNIPLSLLKPKISIYLAMILVH